MSYTSKFGVLAPVAIESPVFDADTNEPINFQRLFPVSRIELGGMVADPQNIATQLIVVAFGDTAKVTGGPPCLARLGALPPNQIQQSTFDVYRVTPEGQLDTELIVSFLTTSGLPCVSSLHGNVVAGYTIDDITPTGANGMTTKPILADLDTDADRCPGLINSDAGAGALRIWDGDTVGGHCILKPAGTDGAALPSAPAAPGTAVAIGRIELVPPIAGIARDALVMTSGVYGHVPVAVPPFVPQPTLLELYSSNGRQLAFVATGDLDNDGKLDAVLATGDQDDLDVLFRFDSGLQLLRIDTASHTTSLTIGDYDANGILDIAYTETNGDHQDMMIAYGTDRSAARPDAGRDVLRRRLGDADRVPRFGRHARSRDRSRGPAAECRRRAALAAPRQPAAHDAVVLRSAHQRVQELDGAARRGDRRLRRSVGRRLASRSGAVRRERER